VKILFLFIVLFRLMQLAAPYVLKLIIDRLSDFSAEQVVPLLVLIGAFFLSEQATSLVGYLKDRRTFSFLVNVEYDLPVRVQEKLVNLSLDYHERENTGNKITKTERGIFKIVELLANMSFELVPTLVQLVVTLIALSVVDWRIGLSFAFFSPLFIFITFRVNKSLHPWRKARYEKHEEASGKMGQSIININAVKSFTQEAREKREYGGIRDKLRNWELYEWSTLLKWNLGRNFIIDLGRVTILILSVYLALQGEVTIGSLVFAVTLSEKAYFSLYRLSRFYDRMEEGAEAVNRFVDIINEEPTIKSPENGIRPGKIEGRIRFENVDFSYEGQKSKHFKALQGVNLDIVPGGVTALVGPSGGGKSTVAKMIYRHYDPQKGRVLLDGRDLRDHDLWALRSSIAIVPQEVEVFDLSVRGNIAYAKPKASREEIEEAARIANADEFIKELPYGYETLVGERGMKLSGGQRQRVGIARAVLADPSILIFDEATSNLDSYSEGLIQQAMERIGKGRTMIIIAHRLSTIKKANKIIVLENGRAVEQGSHEELAKSEGGLYRKLLDLQKTGNVD
jgi:ABC-type multidrug transport system fused ATPase/permease subunit